MNLYVTGIFIILRVAVCHMMTWPACADARPGKNTSGNGLARRCTQSAGLVSYAQTQEVCNLHFLGCRYGLAYMERANRNMEYIFYSSVLLCSKRQNTDDMEST